jgi:preprotein translocase SecE subunit
MAVAVKNTPEIASHGLLDRMAVASLAGTVYAIGWIGIVFYLVPGLWWRAFDPRSAVAWSFLILLDLAVAFGVGLVGVRLLGPRAARGVRAGICAGLAGVVLVLLLARWASLWFEYGVYDAHWFGAAVGEALSAAACALLLAGLVRLFFHPRFEQFLLRVEDQGWFRATAYKANQGQKVRRGTVLGLLLIAAAGVYTLLNHGTLKRAPADWALNVPFTAQIAIDYPGDVAPFLPPPPPGGDKPVVSRAELDRINREHADPNTKVKIYLPGNTIPGMAEWKVGQVVDRSEFDERIKELSARGLPDVPVGVPPQGASGTVSARQVVLLPGLQFTVPLLLLALSLWLSWRVVNLPVFADFLIATEAELNKVSWTTQRRLMQDTVVVLVTVLLMAVFLFGMDQVWRVVLSWKPIGVLQIPEEKQGVNTRVEAKDW